MVFYCKEVNKASQCFLPHKVNLVLYINYDLETICMNCFFMSVSFYGTVTILCTTSTLCFCLTAHA